MAVSFPTARKVAPLLLAAALLLGLLLGPARAEAHTSLLQAAPVPGAVAEEGPREIELALSERVVEAGSSVRVKGPDGEAYPAARLQTRGGTRLVTDSASGRRSKT